jgi:hypothetical protein
MTTVSYVFRFTVPCSVGSYFEKETKKCVPCAVGSYQSESGQLQCSVCPAIAGRQGVTVSTGARSASHCKERCPAGKYYDDEAGITTTRPVCAEVAVTVFTSRRKAVLNAFCAASARLHGPQRLCPKRLVTRL